MLDREVFKKGLKKLTVEYGNKGFIMEDNKVAQWYEYMKSMSDEEFNQNIDYVLKNCSYAPCMADIFKAKIHAPIKVWGADN